MNIGFGLQFSREFTNEDFSIIDKIEVELNTYLESKSYGVNIEKIYIGIICVSKDFEPFFNVRPLKIYRKEKTFEYELKLDFNKMINSDNEKRKKIIYTEIFKTTKEIFSDKKVNGFDSDKFVIDLEFFTRSEKYI
ncbi:Imm44 family immunity protein [Flavobacterium sp.]|uniref:Imm44 family immunity protein n=1 Tax=Flavobacterium sp. TaxID=239 RepID=UPI0037500FAF